MAHDFIGRSISVGDKVQFWRERDEAERSGKKAKTYTVKAIVPGSDYWGYQDVELENQPDSYTLRALVRIP